MLLCFFRGLGLFSRFWLVSQSHFFLKCIACTCSYIQGCWEEGLRRTTVPRPPAPVLTNARRVQGVSGLGRSASCCPGVPVTSSPQYRCQLSRSRLDPYCMAGGGGGVPREIPSDVDGATAPWLVAWGWWLYARPFCPLSVWEPAPPSWKRQHAGNLIFFFFSFLTCQLQKVIKISLKWKWEGYSAKEIDKDRKTGEIGKRKIG